MVKKSKTTTTNAIAYSDLTGSETFEASKILELRLPYPPSVNRYWRAFRGRLIISKIGREYHKEVALLLKELSSPPETGRLAVSILATMPDRRTRDIDNILKVCLDSLTKCGIWHDDSQIDEIFIKRGKVSRPGCVQVEVWRL